MDRIKRLFLLLIVIGPFHMIEQMLTSIDEFYWIRSLVDGYYAWFAPLPTDLVSVILITAVWTKVSLLFYALVVGGTPRLAVFALFGLFGASEAHHLLEALAKGGYDAGVITSIPYSALGCLLLAEVWKEFRTATAVRPALTSLA